MDIEHILEHGTVFRKSSEGGPQKEDKVKTKAKEGAKAK